jgi:hypothetical protein
MAKLTGAAKKAFLERMKKGRRKAARGAPKKKAARKPAKKKAAKKPAKKKAANPRGKLRGAKKAAARGKNPSVRKSKKLFRKTFGRDVTKKRRNTSEAEAAAMYETFHGKAPRRIVHYEELVKFPHHFAECGRLIELRINLDRANPRYPFTSFGDCKVVTTPDGENLYFVGGDQRINLENLEIGGDKDMVELGPCVYICYHTTKDFHDFAPIDYEHHFGEENGVRPVLAYDRLNKKLFLIGGDYRVKREGIAN